MTGLEYNFNKNGFEIYVGDINNSPSSQGAKLEI